jgi:hypothetical protein
LRGAAFLKEKLREDTIPLDTSTVETTLPPASKYHRTRRKPASADLGSSTVHRTEMLRAPGNCKTPAICGMSGEATSIFLHDG